MKEPKRYYCGNGEVMFEDYKNGNWVKYSEHKAIVEALTKQLSKPHVSCELADFVQFLTDEYSIKVPERVIDEWEKYYSANYR